MNRFLNIFAVLLWIIFITYLYISIQQVKLDSYQFGFEAGMKAGIQQQISDTPKPEYDFFTQSNATLPTPIPNRPRVVFLGDSITRDWSLKKYFGDLSIEPINRGLGGEITDEMLLRYITDVIKLQPKAVVILAGTNDVMKLRVSSTVTTTNLTLMCDLAHSQNIQVLLATIPPTREPKLTDDDNSPKSRQIIRKDINLWIKKYCTKKRFYLIDDHELLADENQLLRPEYANDTIHFSGTGYEVISSLVRKQLVKIFPQARP